MERQQIDRTLYMKMQGWEWDDEDEYDDDDDNEDEGEGEDSLDEEERRGKVMDRRAIIMLSLSFLKQIYQQ